MQYSIYKGVLKALKVFLLFAIPVLIDAFVFQYPAVAQLTVGGILYLIWNFLKVKGFPFFKTV